MTESSILSTQALPIESLSTRPRAHVGIRAVYDRHDYVREVRAALDASGAELDSILSNRLVPSEGSGS